MQAYWPSTILSLQSQHPGGEQQQAVFMRSETRRGIADRSVNPVFHI